MTGSPNYRAHGDALEGAARRYLASRGRPPLAARPVALALPLLLQEAAALGRDGVRDMALATAMVLATAAMVLSLAPALDIAGALRALLRLEAEGLAGLAACIWSVMLMEAGLSRLGRRWRLRRLLRRGAWPDAFRLALASSP